MTEQTEYIVDRTGWSVGPWDDEPDRVDWYDPETQLPCLALRNPRGGNWCGYVAVPLGHPFHGKLYDDLYDYETEMGTDLDVHGGLTYSDSCGGPICHVPRPGESDDVWWFGFDCAHAFDLSPGIEALLQQFTPPNEWAERLARAGYDGVFRDTYKPLGYVQDECRSLAMQLARVAIDARYEPGPTTEP